MSEREKAYIGKREMNRIKKIRKNVKNKEHWIKVYEDQLDLYRIEYNQHKTSMKCSNCGNISTEYICEKCGWDRSDEYTRESNLQQEGIKFVKNSMDIITKIALLDEECGLKWMNRYQTIIKKLGVERSDIE